MELLTIAEREILTKTKELYDLIQEAIPEGPKRVDSLRELAFHIHGIQSAFMGNTAARAYPEHFTTLAGD